jgi:hypothetical protein
MDVASEKVVLPELGVGERLVWSGAMGLYMVFGRFITDAVRRGKTFYGLKDRRAMMIQKAREVYEQLRAQRGKSAT